MRYECYVCGGTIRGEPVQLAAGIGRPPVYRHERCAPGTARYLRNPKLRRRLWKLWGSRSAPDWYQARKTRRGGRGAAK